MNITHLPELPKGICMLDCSYTMIKALPELPPNQGSQKIGYTELKNVHERIHPQVNTPAFKLKYDLLWSAPAFFKNGTDSFIDKTFHKFLVKKGIVKKFSRLSGPAPEPPLHHRTN